MSLSLLQITRIPKPVISFILLLLLGFIWGTGYSIARFAVTNSIPPLGYSFWQSLGPALLVGSIVYARKYTRVHKTLNQQEKQQKYYYYFICGLTGIAIPNSCMYFAASHLPASILAIVVNIVPVITYAMALILQLERFHWQRATGIVLACCGLLLLLLPQSGLSSENRAAWIILSLVTPFSFAFCSTFIARHYPKASDPLTLTTGMLVASSLLLLPVVFFTHSFYFPHLPLTAPDWVILLEIILSSIGYILLFQLIKVAGPVYYSLTDTIVVLTGLFWGYFIFNEQLNKWTGTAMFLILFALLLVTQQQRTTQRALQLITHD